MSDENNNNLVIEHKDRPVVIPSDYISTFLQFMRTIDTEYNYYVEEVEKYQNATQDLLHILEFQDLDAVKMMKLAKQLREIRRERRKCKNIVEIYEPIVKFIDDPNTNKDIKDLERLLGKVRKLEDRLSNRKYSIKVKTEDVENLL